MKRLLGLILIAAASALAQAPGPFPWWDSPIVRDLNLSEDQQKKIRATVHDYRDRLIEQRAAVQKAEGALEDLMNDDPADEAKVTQAIERLIAARGDLMRAFSQMGLRLRQVLTAQQWQELQKRRPRDRMFPGRMRDGMRRNPGRPDEPPRPPEPPPPGADPQL